MHAPDQNALSQISDLSRSTHSISVRRSHALPANPDPQLNAKASSGTFFMPESEDVIGHRDANLQVDDFFSRTSAAL
eukprot:jgi/Mesen1/10279/ME000789S09557